MHTGRPKSIIQYKKTEIYSLIIENYDPKLMHRSDGPDPGISEPQARRSKNSWGVGIVLMPHHRYPMILVREASKINIVYTLYVDLNEIIFVSCSQQSKLLGIERNSAINLFYIRISIFWFSLLAQENIWKSDSINTRLIKIYFSCFTCTVIPRIYPCNRWEMSLEKGIKSSFTRSP